MDNEETTIPPTEGDNIETELEEQPENQEKIVFQEQETEPVQAIIEEIEIYSEITSEPLIIADENAETVETSVTETTTETTTTTLIDYQAEIYKNTKISAECLAFQNGLLLIVSAVLICVAIAKVFIDY